MTVVQLPRRREALTSQLLIVFADMQLEYVSPGRAYAIDSVADCLAASQTLLAAARTHRLPILHFRQLRPEPFFNAASPFSGWIEQFRPRASEAVFDRAQPSIYASADFCSYVAGIKDPTIVLTGLSSDRVCLASAVEASQRGHRMIFVQDCSACSSLTGESETQSHRLVSELIGRFVETSSSDDLVSLFSEPQGLGRKRV